MPSVGSTPTITSPAQQQPSHHPKLQHQHSLPLQLQFPHKQQVTTTQPSPAGTITGHHIVASFGDKVTNIDTDADDDPSTLSSTNSFSSVDTNQTLLNSIATQTQQHGGGGGNRSSSIGTTNRSYRSKYNQFMIITPAVSIDRNFDNATGASAENDIEESYFHNGNIFRMTLLQSSIDSGNSSDSSFRSNYNPNIYSSRHRLLPKTAPPFYTFSSWRWCTLICAAMRCFGGGHSSNAPYSTSFTRPPYQRSRSSGGGNQFFNPPPQRRVRSYSTSAEPFSAFTPRKTRDNMNNITYEL